MLVDPSGEEDLKWPGLLRSNNGLNEIGHQNDIVTLIKSIDNYDGDWLFESKERGLFVGETKRINEQFLELICGWLTENIGFILQLLLDEGFSGWDRSREMIGKCRHQAGDLTSTS